MSQKVALVTGASSGIGYATALAFARRKVHVIATARRTDKLAQLQHAVDLIGKPHGDLLSLGADVQQAADMENVVQRTLDHFGRLDYLVANAGVGLRGSVVDSNWSDIETLLRTNIDGVLHSVRAAVPVMRKSGGGHIIITSSIVYNMVSPYAAPYAASKAFVSSIAAALRFELEADHIAVSDLLVGRTESEFNEKRLGQSGYAEGASRLPRMKADQVAEAIVNISERKHSVRTTLRLFDRLVVLGNMLIPNFIGRRAMRQYK